MAYSPTPPPDLTFAGTSFHLTQQSNPAPGYSKAEYLPRDQQFPHYHNMLMLEQLSNGLTASHVVQSQLDFLAQRQASDPVAQHRLISNEATGEFLLDFVLSGQDPERGTLIEWNAYRYSPQTHADGSVGVLLLGYSARAYGDEEGSRFLLSLRESRPQMIQALIAADAFTGGLSG